MQILSIVDFFVCIVNTCTRYYSMHDAVDNYLESCGANRPSIGGEETILAHRQITADWRLIAYYYCPVNVLNTLELLVLLIDKSHF